MNDASVVKTIVDICSRSFKIVSDEGYIQLVQCESVEEFMGVLEVCQEFMDEDMIVFSEVITKPKRNRSYVPNCYQKHSIKYNICNRI